MSNYILSDGEIDIDETLIESVSFSDTSDCCDIFWKGKDGGNKIYQPFIKITSPLDVSVGYKGQSNAQDIYYDFINPLPGSYLTLSQNNILYFVGWGHDFSVPLPVNSILSNQCLININEIFIWRKSDMKGVKLNIDAACYDVEGVGSKISIQTNAIILN